MHSFSIFSLLWHYFKVREKKTGIWPISKLYNNIIGVLYNIVFGILFSTFFSWKCNSIFDELPPNIFSESNLDSTTLLDFLWKKLLDNILTTQEYHVCILYLPKIVVFQWPLVNLSTINASIHLYVRKRVAGTDTRRWPNT